VALRATANQHDLLVLQVDGLHLHDSLLMIGGARKLQDQTVKRSLE